MYVQSFDVYLKNVYIGSIVGCLGVIRYFKFFAIGFDNLDIVMHGLDKCTECVEFPFESNEFSKGDINLRFIEKLITKVM
jgi:hypothetical protein